MHSTCLRMGHMHCWVLPRPPWPPSRPHHSTAEVPVHPATFHLRAHLEVLGCTKDIRNLPAAHA